MVKRKTTNFGYKLLAGVILIITLAQVFTARGFDDPLFNPDPTPTPTPAPDDSLRFPIEEKENLDPSRNAGRSSIDLKDPANIKKGVEYDPDEKRYYLNEKVGEENIKNPTYMDAEEYLKYRGQQDETDYWKERLDALSMFNQKPKLPTLYKEGIFDRLFGSNKISVKPQGNLDLTFGGNWQNMKNPNLTQRAQKYGIFDFDMQMNVNLLAQIGDKLKLNISNNTQPTFGEQNLQKLEYTGKEDEIIKKIEAGNVSFPLHSALLQGPLALFGLKAQLQFGKLFVTGVISQQKSQRKSINLQGGAQTQAFEIKADDYEENRNFLLGQYFYNNYEPALKNFPIINSQVVLTKVEVWLTNRTGATQGVRDILAFMDLGEKNPYLPSLVDPSGGQLPDNRVNRLYQQITQLASARSQATATQSALSLGLAENQDFQRVTMRQLSSSEFTFQPQLGYISLNTQINPDDVLAVSYRYTYNGKIYQVGEFAEDMPPDTANVKVMFLKLLKGTAARPVLPIWNLMMKNVYSMGGGNISQEDFRLNVLYQDPGGGEKRYIPDGPSAGVPLITLLNLDRLNPQRDPAPDGIFDFVEGITINTQQGKIIFPQLKPFGDGLKPAMGGDPRLERRYLFPMLYDSTKTVARQFQQNNRFLIKGSYKGAAGNDVSLGGYNIPQGSVTVTAGGQRLAENVDYTVDYSRGSVKVINQGILASGIPINISYEDNATFGLVAQNFWGTRFDYFANEHLTIGSTIMRLTERPFTQKVTFGDDPIKNTVVGFDANYQNEFPWLTRTLDKLPIYSTTAPSLISLSGEVAGIFPGHQRFINAIDPEGSVFIDDFEGTNSSIDLRFPVTSWTLSSTPVGAKDANGRTLFPEATLNGDLKSGTNRAKLAWYMLEPTLIDGSFGTPANVKADTSMQDYWRMVEQRDVFPQRTQIASQNNLSTFDLGYYPYVRGPYNFDVNNVNMTTGNFTNPRDRWGGIQRAIDNNSSDFEAANVEYITFWMLDPFIYNTNSTGGDLYLNLGNVSEDVLKDSRLSFENGITYPKDYTKLDITPWGFVPRFQQQITRSFDNDPEARKIQDVGYDEMDDEEEGRKFADFLQRMQDMGASGAVLSKLQSDPASDNFHHFRGQDYDQLANRQGEALLRYKDFNNPSGNSPVTDLNSQFTSSGSTIPESEDINRDNSLNETEAYYQYRIRMMPANNPAMQVGQNFIVDRKISDVKLANGRTQSETWYQFKVPIRQYDNVVGGIGDFRSIRFVRMFMSGFQDSVIMRFAQLQLDRNQWRRYLFSLVKPGENIPEEDQRTTTFAVNSVSLEQNSQRIPIPYVIPPGVSRQNTPGGIGGQNLQLDEQSLSLQLCGLKDGDARAAFKETRVDMRQYKSLRMFIHAESVPSQAPVRDGDLMAFIRVGSDFINNYYEYQIPLKITQPGVTSSDAELIWPAANRLDILMSKLIDIKTQRNAQNYPSYLPFITKDDVGNTVVVVGNPNFGDVKNIMLGVANPKKTLQTPLDDGQPKCAEVWFDELRMAGLDEQPGYAASGQTNIQLADLGNVHLGASTHTIGYGNIDQKVDQRFRDNFYAYDVSSNLNFGKLLPKSLGLQLPVFFGYTQTVSNPKYDPYDKDVVLSDKIASVADSRQRDSIRKASQDFTSVTSFNLSNVRYMGNPEKQGKAPMPWSLKNFDLSYAYNRSFKRNPLLAHDEMEDQRLGIGYNYSIKANPIEPFKKLIKSKSRWWAPIKEFNFNLLPSSFSFRSDLHRIFGETQVRNIDGGPYAIPSTYFKNFTWDRTYNLRWELTRALSFSYTANNQSRIDEPYGRLDSKEKRDSIWRNIARFGRNTYFSQSLNVTYTLPTQKFPILDWTRATATYTSTYNWTAASLLANDQGNIMANTQLKQINGEFTFSQLYNKSRLLKAINTPKVRERTLDSKTMQVDDPSGKLSPAGGGKSMMTVAQKSGTKDQAKTGQVPPRPKKKEIKKKDVPGYDTLSAGDLRAAWKKLKKAEKVRFKKELAAWRAKKKNILPEISDGVRAVGRLATMLKRVTVSYSESAGTILPGFMDSTQFFGVNSRSGNSWYDFAFGAQPDREWLDRQAELQRISRNPIFNGQLQQTFNQNLNLVATVEPVPDLRIDLTWTKQFSKSYSETFKFDTSVNKYEHYSPYSMGTFNVSFIGLKTMFTPLRANELSEPYMDFLNYRKIISERLGNINPYTGGLNDPDDPEYKKGYTRYAQDVLIPAFLAAYGGRNPATIPLMNNNSSNIRSNPFKYYTPMPNWRLTYNGLSKLPFFSDYVNTFTINHSYTGNLSMNSFVSSFYYLDQLAVGFPSFIDSNSHNYVPFFQVPNITISESLGPLLGFDVAFKNGVSISIKFNKTRMLSLSLVDYQVSETKSTELVVGGGSRIKGLNLPFTIFGTRRLKNDINFRMDIGYRDDITSNSYLAQNTNIPTRGQKVITISPSIDYIINDNLQLRFFYDRRQSIPVMSTSFPITTTRAGMTLRFLFAPQ
ncbi:cell surface protein SprA [Taibaiella chishuiensis]|uniref:Cell surface protein SprA n=1 Tax=Taibaiella chishuiensis TaxID=1434707 RepID=A0A2P8DB13_9BACT|nr:cell surface protein SprA [Taibaiella chishuiensis]